ncbi:MAG: peptidoglycan DD-metalloendopeptidase family protein [Saprospiraceae bacterium]
MLPHPTNLETWLAAHPASVIDLRGKRTTHLDLSTGSADLDGHSPATDLPAFTRRITDLLKQKRADFGYGGYRENRPFYTGDDFVEEGENGPRRRSIHLGLDIWGPAGTPVLAAYDGKVVERGVDPTQGGYGNVILLEHQWEEGVLYTLYGHLAAMQAGPPQAGVNAGQVLGQLGEPEENGGWPPHLHFQVMRELLGYTTDYPGVAHADELDEWGYRCPDPGPLLGLR